MPQKTAAKKRELNLVGGQAVIEGVMMRSGNSTAVAVRTESGKIVTKGLKISPLSSKVRPLKYPMLRGIGVLYDTLVVGFKALSFSANASAGVDEKGEEVIGKREMVLSFAFALVVGISIFVLGPFFLARLIAKNNTVLFNVVDGIFRLLAFVAYLVFISMFKDIQRIFQYHGAEHMTIHAYEHREKLIPLKIRKYPTMHPRCGTSFLLIVVLLSILVFSVVSPQGILLKLASRLLLLPVIAGASYEILRLGAKFEKSPLMQVLVFPGILMQRITTKEPDSSQIEVAIAALKAVTKMK